MHMNQKKIIHWRYECYSVLILIALFSWLYFNWQVNVIKSHLSESLAFLTGSANFFISDHWLPFSPKDPVWYAILIASINTFVLGVSVIFSATCLGLLFGFFSAYSEYKMQWFTKLYVDLFRNTPLVGQLFFWYFGVFYLMPSEVNTYLDGFVTLSIQSISIYVGHFFSFLSVMYLMMFLFFVIIKRTFGIALITLFISVIYFYFSYSKYFLVSIEWLALYVTLTLYTASYIAELSRAALTSVPQYVDDAATALGLSQKNKLKYVIFPLAFKAMRPMLINQYITIMKNTSIGMLIGYPELMNVLTGTIINNTGQTLVCVILMMFLYLSVCLLCQTLFIKQTERVSY